jgi:hypothetical protein
MNIQTSSSLANLNQQKRPSSDDSPYRLSAKFGALDNKDKQSLGSLLAKLIALGGGLKGIKNDIPDWDNLRLTTKIWRLISRRGEGKPNKGWKGPED